MPDIARRRSRFHRAFGTGRAVVLVCLLLLACSLLSCSSLQKWNRESAANLRKDLLAAGEEDVKKRLGEPGEVARTPDNATLWIYRPRWRLIPSERNTLYVEFREGKVSRIFRIR